MVQELTIYKFKENLVRLLADEKGDPWFVANDIGSILELSDTRKSVNLLDEDERKIMPVMDSIGRQQDTFIVSEPGLYKLIMKSRKPQAKEFQRWVTHEVLPAIRKTGAYINPSVPALATSALKEATRILAAVVDKIDEHDARLSELEKDRQIVAVISAPVKEISTRLKINQIVRTYAQHHDKDYRECFKTLYYEFKYRYGIDLVGRTHNNGNKTVLDTAEQLGCLDDLFTLAVALFVGK
jgi:prophage antirepressor-like protein